MLNNGNIIKMSREEPFDAMWNVLFFDEWTGEIALLILDLEMRTVIN